MSQSSASPRFQLIRRLAAGGMGEVLLADFVGDERLSVSPGLVVLKRTLSDSNQRAEQVRMLREEGRVGLRLRHENLVETFSLESLGQDTVLVIEYLAGKSMAQVLGAAKRNQQPVPVAVALRILRDAACGLHFAHTLQIRGQKLGLVHRDVSPANIFVTFDGRAKVIDFGVAKAKDSEIRTSTGILKGKTGYMSPEQAMGDVLDARADLWSLGVFLWEMLLAERLFVGPNPAVTLSRIATLEIPRPSTRRSDVSRDVDALCMRLLERNLGRRFATGADVVQAIDGLGSIAEREELARFVLSRFPEDATTGLDEARRAARTLGTDPPPSGLADGASGDWQEHTLTHARPGVVYERSNLMHQAIDEADAAYASSVPDGPVMGGAAATGAPGANDDTTRPTPMLLVDEGARGPAASGPGSVSPPPLPDDTRPVPMLLPVSAPTGVDPPPPASGAPATGTAPQGAPGAPRAAERPAPSTPPPPAPIHASAPAAPAPSPFAATVPTAPPEVLSFGQRVANEGVALALATFGALAVTMSLGLVWLAAQQVDERALIVYRYGDVDRTDIIVGRADDAPPGVTPEPFAVAGAALRTRGEQAARQPYPADALARLLERAGVTERARLPMTTRARLTAALPPIVAGLGLLALAMALPALALTRGRARQGVRLAALTAWALVGWWVAEQGLWSWPGFAAFDDTRQAPRVQMRDHPLAP